MRKDDNTQAMNAKRIPKLFFLVLMPVAITSMVMLPSLVAHAACDPEAVHLHHWTLDPDYWDLEPDNIQYIVKNPHEMQWQELYRPHTCYCCDLHHGDWCDYWLGWEDVDGDGKISPGDQATITPMAPGIQCTGLGCLGGLYQVRQVTVTLKVAVAPPIIDPFRDMYIEFEGNIYQRPWWPPPTKWDSPNNTQWCELCPYPFPSYHLENWRDLNGVPGNLSIGDRIDLRNKATGNVTSYDVTQVRVDLALIPLRMAVPLFPNWYTVIAAVAVTGGLGYLIWRRWPKRA